MLTMINTTPYICLIHPLLKSGKKKKKNMNIMIALSIILDQYA
jgi:hypothetical protein